MDKTTGKTTEQSPPKIAIIGAGPAGCMLARLLHLAGIPVTVFEGEASPNYRSQGGTLDLHTHTGIAALKQAGLFDKFLEKARYDGDFLQITDKNLKESSDPEKDPSTRRRLAEQRPEIDRADLRRILTESLPDGTIKWGYHLKQLNLGSDSRSNALVFEKNSEIETERGFNLVIGADGAWSKVRGALSDQRPEYAGVGMIEMSIPEPATRAPELYATVNRGNLFGQGEGKRLVVQQMGDGTLTVHIGFATADEHWTDSCGYDATDLAQTQAALLRQPDGLFADWHSMFHQAVLRAETKCIPRTLHKLPVGFRWGHRRGVTLVGDAAHLMTPFAGEGVNVALEDALRLARGIIGAVEGGADDGLDRGVVAFEEEMWARAEKVARLTDQLTNIWMFSKGDPRSFIPKAMALHLKFRIPGFLHPLASPFTHSYFFLKNSFQR
ncbi:hypothetical protein B0T26DRAFT_655435 [Lasiosphaeria miniovina]|uniref:FAD-binding domain-containing protein n=1 Tax=Lasiosphaeria miniovina TaxID=1954250 RepID=A0AA40DNH6_9PEZI|nr:uncharacterized protein B0T26DRAFT_655435 [Lasiosphaeria miniovina]KAK0706338.1 hypothetical protein B0T26DRAFT_655435 [Lasiosphaeria miniovina]